MTCRFNGKNWPLALQMLGIRMSMISTEAELRKALEVADHPGPPLTTKEIDNLVWLWGNERMEETR